VLSEEVAAQHLLERHGLAIPPADITELVSSMRTSRRRRFPSVGDAMLIEYPRVIRDP